jgi:hypothetical protein
MGKKSARLISGVLSSNIVVLSGLLIVIFNPLSMRRRRKYTLRLETPAESRCQHNERNRRRSDLPPLLASSCQISMVLKGVPRVLYRYNNRFQSSSSPSIRQGDVLSADCEVVNNIAHKEIRDRIVIMIIFALGIFLRYFRVLRNICLI